MKTAIAGALLGLALLTTGCATKEYVGEEVGATNRRIDDVEGQVEANQSGIRSNRESIDRQGRDIQATSRTAQEALERATAAGKLAQGKFLYEVALTDDKIRFGFNNAEISEEGRAALTEFSEGLKTQNKNVYIEIQGHTDSVGSEDYNYKLGLERAEAVRRFLNLDGGIPLHRISVISYGESAPIADNGTREGRAQNRRVVLVVLE